MRLNADFSKRAVVRPGDSAFVPSPSAGVERRMLDRLGEEVARATSIVRYAPGSSFREHVHGGGEEYLVLDGVFSDESGDYARGHYVRNPVGTAHAPYTEQGATILVKLWQFAPDDETPVSIDTTAWDFRPAGVHGVEELQLHRFGTERVRLLRFAPGTEIPPHDHPGGEEIFVIEGDLADEHGAYLEGTWLRSPDGSHHGHRTEGGCLLYVKSGHLYPGDLTLMAPEDRS